MANNTRLVSENKSSPYSPLKIELMFIYIFYINNQDQKKGQEAENRMETENVFEALGSKTMA